MVDLGAEGEGGWFEWVFFWEDDLDVEAAALRRDVSVTVFLILACYTDFVD